MGNIGISQSSITEQEKKVREKSVPKNHPYLGLERTKKNVSVTKT